MSIFKRLLFTTALLLLLIGTLVACNGEASEPLTVRSLTYGIGGRLPEAADFFEDLPTDYRARFAQEYQYTAPGDYDLTVIVTDPNGKEREYDVTFRLILDSEAPQIAGAKDLSVYIGDGVSYLGGVTASDNCDGAVDLKVDHSAVDLAREGVYPIIYTATDAAGNKSVLHLSVYVYREQVTIEMLYELLDPLIESHISTSASLERQVRDVYDYVYYSIDYDGFSDKNDWIRAAYDGLRSGKGDCFTYFAISKAFFDRLGIENMDITRTEGLVDERHYWNLVNIGTKSEPKWYHYDSTQLIDGLYTCLLTDAQVQAYTAIRQDELGNSRYFYAYDASRYPKSAEEIITELAQLKPYL